MSCTRFKGILAGILLILFPLCSTNLEGQEKRPNFLFIIADDQSPYDLKIYNPDSELSTPNIDRLASEGLVLDGSYHMGAWAGGVCTPSRHMIMSGRTLWHIPDKPGSWRNPQELDPEMVPVDLAEHTMAAIFNAAGYATMRTCKRGNSYEAANAKFKVRHDQVKREGNDENGSAWHAEQVLNYLNDRDSIGIGDPFLIYFGFSHPHDPRNGKEGLLEKYGAVNHKDKNSLPAIHSSQPALPANYLPEHPFPHGHPGLRDEVKAQGVWTNRDEATIRNEMGREFACSENIDIQIGRVLDKLEEMGELDNTYIIYTADHGIAIGKHGLQGKQNLYEHTWRVPFIVKGPGVKQGRAMGNIYLADVLGTLCDLAGIEIPETVESTSFKPVLEGKQETVREVLYGAYSGGTKPGMRAVRKGDWKLIKYDVLDGTVRKTQLFNLAENPDELLKEHHDPEVVKLTGYQPEAAEINLADNPEYADKLAEMEALLLDEMIKYDDPYRLWNQHSSVKHEDSTGSDTGHSSAAQVKDIDQKMKWWADARFGMFIHFGVYSDLGGVWKGEPVKGYAEHIMRTAQIPLEVYKKEVVANFNPAEFDADEWVSICKNAGMKYLVITSKHHDGFAMFDSKITDYDIVDATPFKRDIIAELKEACDRAGIKFGLYYSHAQDWSHPYGQRNVWDYPGQPTRNRWWMHEPWKSNGWEDKTRIYAEEKSIPQLKEIVSQYDPAIIWFDTELWINPELQEEIVKTARDMDENTIFSSRSAPGYADYLSTTDMPAEFPSQDGYWEAIPTTNHSYGYHSMDNDYKTSAHFIQLLAKAGSKGGNLLLNVGPKGNGLINNIDIEILKGVGDWLKINGESIYGTEKSILPVNAWGVITQKDNRVYLHVFDWVKDEHLIVGGLKSKVKKAYMLSDPTKKALRVKRINPEDIDIEVPERAPDTINTVIVVECEEEIEAGKNRLVAVNMDVNTFHVFDGKLHGEKITYGRGHSYDDYILNWINPEDYVSWEVRLNEKSEFDLFISYKAIAKSAGNVCKVNIGEFSFNHRVEEGTIEEMKLGTISIDPGVYQLEVKAENMDGELMRLRNVKLKLKL